MAEKNPFYISQEECARRGYTQQQVKMLKENNQYWWRIVSKLILTKGDTRIIKPAYRRQILSGELYNSDKKLGIDTNGLGEKLKALFIALDDKDNREKFLNSYFYTACYNMASGTANSSDITEKWANFAPSANCEDCFKGREAIDSALTIYKGDVNSPIGIDISKFIDSIVKKDEDGRYNIVDTTAAEGEKLCNAVNQHVKDLKASDRFKKNFVNKILHDPEDENDEENS